MTLVTSLAGRRSWSPANLACTRLVPVGRAGRAARSRVLVIPVRLGCLAGVDAEPRAVVVHRLKGRNYDVRPRSSPSPFSTPSTCRRLLAVAGADSLLVATADTDERKPHWRCLGSTLYA
jgi:hypothetical protein